MMQKLCSRHTSFCVSCRILTFFLSLICLFSSIRAAEKSRNEKLTVKEIRIVGNYAVKRSAVLERLEVQEGETFSTDSLQRKVKKLNKWGGFGTVGLKTERIEGEGVELHVEIREKIKIASIEFQGNRCVSSRRLKDILQLKSGDTVTPRDIIRDQKTIVEAYNAAGRTMASARAKASFGESPECRLVFHIYEGPKVRVRRIESRGNKVLSDKKIRHVMETKKRYWLPFLRPGVFKRSVFRKDFSRIKDKYYSLGYLDANVAGYWEHTENFNGLALNIVVNEGKQYHIDRIIFQGNTIFRDEELADAIPIAEGDPFRPKKLERAEKIIGEMYGSQGYVDARTRGSGRIEARLIFPEETRGEVKIVFPLVEGDAIHIRRICVEGLTKTREVVVLRRLTFLPGDRVDTTQLKRSEERLEATGYFDHTAVDPVDIKLRPEKGALRDAVIQVKEGRTGSLSVGGGYGSEIGAMAHLSLKESNFDIGNFPTSWHDFWEGNAFRGAGQKFELSLRASSDLTTFNILFSDPHIFDSNYRFGTNAFARVANWGNFALDTTGGQISAGKNFGNNISVTARIGYEHFDMHDIDDDAPPEVKIDEGTYDKPYFGLSLGQNKREGGRIPYGGYLASLSAEVGFSDIETIKLQGNFKKYWTIYSYPNESKHILKMRARAGYLYSYNDERIPVFERFYAGGLSSIRGFERHGVSPVDPIKNEQIGGESLLVGSVEYSIPVYKNDIRLAAFVDAGYVEEDASDLFNSWDELRVGAGVGLRWFIRALGGIPVSIDFARAVEKEEYDETENVHFTLGTTHMF